MLFEMKNLIILVFLLIISFKVEAQASYQTNIAFTLRDDKNEKIDLERFKEEYKIKDVMGDIISLKNLESHLSYNDETGYFILRIVSIGPRFSFALLHKNHSMIVYLPFKHKYNYYALDLKFKHGRYLFDFSIEDKEKIYLNSNMPYYLIDKIKWRKQRKSLIKSTYDGDETYNNYLVP